MTISADQKHNSAVAHRSYKKRLSREVATKGRQCMDKMLGSCRTDSSSKLTSILTPDTSSTDGNSDLANILAATSMSIDNIDDSVIARTQEILSTSSQDGLSNSLNDDKETPITDVVVTGSVPETTSGASCAKENEPMDLPMWPAGPSAVPSGASSAEVVVTGTVSGIAPPTMKEDESEDTPTWPASSQQIVDIKEEEEHAGKRLRDRKATKKFSEEEDRHLILGVQKYGRGHWGKIIKDPTYKFDKGRSRDSLRVRYGSAEIKRLLKQMQK